MIKIYQYFSKGFNSNIQVHYKDGVIQKIEVEAPENVSMPADKARDECRAWFFIYEDSFLKSTKGHTEVVEITKEISFEMFWETYKQKDCGRKKAEESWNRLSYKDKQGAYYFIPAYNATLKLNNVPKLYATTYLNQKRWIR